MAPIQRQAIIWTNAEPIHWCIYVALGGDELILTAQIIVQDNISKIFILMGILQLINTLAE